MLPQSIKLLRDDLELTFDILMCFWRYIFELKRDIEMHSHLSR